MSGSCTVHSTCSVYIIEESQCGDKGPYNHNGNSAGFLLTDGCRGVSVPEMETVVLLQARRRVAALAQVHAVLHCHGSCAAESPVLSPRVVFLRTLLWLCWLSFLCCSPLTACTSSKESQQGKTEDEWEDSSYIGV